ncbi:PREDICTED: protein NUCLEAR FUSION DEFECTIVE 4-like [Tarenaya hassleriana]|uniref:protein NUCLEAR FUSION DEFECTIVE 4-like n=1 Tax=Tarenaya hassleriana TaxID=28532 RepID=UPI00053C5DE3|nr:PREDICTED: protein NUCLEAR FUSION DEFECTIVE 4-like [Tarenaya hassleriana]
MGRVSSAAKWLGFVTAIWVQAICGNNYTFSNYSDSLKSLMNLSQLQLNNLSVAKDVGKAFGLISGFASDYLPPSVILIIGALEGLVGYGAQWLVVSKKISPLPYWQMCVFLCLGGNSTTWMNTAVLVTCMRSFPGKRGPVSGILKGYLGLSTAIFTDVSTALFSSDPSAFVAILAVVPAVICFIASFFLHETSPASDPEEEKKETKFFNVFNVIAIALAVYLLAFDISGRHGRVLSLVFAAGLFTLLASPVLVPLYAILFKPRSRPDIERSIKEPLLTNQTVQTKIQDQKTDLKPEIGEEHTVPEMMRTLDFWVLFISFLFGVGPGMCVMNNMAQMSLAQGFTDASVFISLISIWGFFGRIASGLMSEHYMRRRGTPRPVWNAVSQVLMTIGYAVMAFAIPGSLYIGSILVGICYGFRLTITVPVASELFGLKYYGMLYNILILNLPLGSFLFSGLLAGYLYDAEARKAGSGGNTCVGAHCYRLVFLIMAVACVVGFGLDMFLVTRTKNLYLKSRIDTQKSESATES